MFLDIADRSGLDVGEGQKGLAVLCSPQLGPEGGLSRAGSKHQTSVIIFLPFTKLSLLPRKGYAELKSRTHRTLNLPLEMSEAC